MTVIAYSDGVLAGDTRITSDDGHIWTDNSKKVYKLENGSLLGLSGDNEADEMIYASACMQAKAGGCPISKMEFPDIGDSEVCGLLIEPDGSIYMTEGKSWSVWPEKFAAIGSGKPYAIALLRKGYSAAEAVKAGIAGDCRCGGYVTLVALDGVEDV